MDVLCAFAADIGARHSSRRAGIIVEPGTVAGTGIRLADPERDEAVAGRYRKDIHRRSGIRRGAGWRNGGDGATATASIGERTRPADSNDADGIGRLFVHASPWVIVAAFFGFGLLLAFTPCMLPMIPILSGIIVGRDQRATGRHAFGLSLVYVLAMAITYALAGVAAGLAGTLLSAYLQNPWVLGGFAAV